jgi:pyruvate dehydrogenase E1 component alpha subunit
LQRDQALKTPVTLFRRRAQKHQFNGTFQPNHEVPPVCWRISGNMPYFQADRPKTLQQGTSKTLQVSLIFAPQIFCPLASKFSKETYLYWYELMQLIRQFELTAEEKYKMEGKIRGFFHAYIGQEAIAAGCMTATKPEDLFITAYRDHGLGIAKGISVNSCMAELYGKATGCAKGKGGSMHFFGKKENFYGGHGIVGAQIGTGAGLAFAEKYRDSDNVVLCFFGDGAARQGILHETFNLAMLWKLPVIFICENNNYAMGTSVERTSNVVDIYKLADGYEMPSDVIDGMQPETVHEGVSRAVKRAREKGGPTLLEIKTYRYKGHSISDPQKYRTKEEVDEYKSKDPINVVRKSIIDNKLASEADLSKIDKRVEDTVAASVKFAEESPWPNDDEVLKDVYVDKNYPFIVD